MGAYTIRELENLSGIKAHTIRIWEKRYGLITPKRTSGNIRMYCDNELKKLLNISVLNRNGVKISTIAKLSREEIVDRINEITDNICIDENQIECLTSAMIDLNESKFEQILTKSIIHFGFEDTVIRILFPFLKRIGLMWQTDSASPLQEHFITNLIKRKIFVAIDGLQGVNHLRSKQFVFFLPEGEYHELVLLFLCYLAKKRGHQVIYLGQSVPENELAEAIHIRHVDYLVLSVTSAMHGEQLEDYIRTIVHKFADTILFIGGARISSTTYNFPSSVRILNSPADFQKNLDELNTVYIK